MADVKLTCRVCGKKYEPCRTAVKNPNVFHWQEVACSPECGAEYLQRVMEARQGKSTNKDPIRKVEVVPVEVSATEIVAEAEHEPELD